MRITRLKCQQSGNETLNGSPEFDIINRDKRHYGKNHSRRIHKLNYLPSITNEHTAFSLHANTISSLKSHLLPPAGDSTVTQKKKKKSNLLTHICQFDMMNVQFPLSLQQDLITMSINKTVSWA